MRYIINSILSKTRSPNASYYMSICTTPTLIRTLFAPGNFRPRHCVTRYRVKRRKALGKNKVKVPTPKGGKDTTGEVQKGDDSDKSSSASGKAESKEETKDDEEDCRVADEGKTDGEEKQEEKKEEESKHGDGDGEGLAARSSGGEGDDGSRTDGYVSVETGRNRGYHGAGRFPQHATALVLVDCCQCCNFCWLSSVGKVETVDKAPDGDAQFSNPSTVRHL